MPGHGIRFRVQGGGGRGSGLLPGHGFYGPGPGR